MMQSGLNSPFAVVFFVDVFFWTFFTKIYLLNFHLDSAVMQL